MLLLRIILSLFVLVAAVSLLMLLCMEGRECRNLGFEILPIVLLG